MHYYKFNIPDWALHTAHLSPEEEGVYLRLVNFYYDTENPIPEKTQSVMRRLRLGSHSDTVGLILEEFFELVDGFWRHKRCDKEVFEYQGMADKNRANGRRGGRPKVSNRKQKPKKTQSVNSGNPNITLTKNHKPLTNNHSKKNIHKKIDLSDIPESIAAPAKEFIDHRINLRKPLTQKAFDRFVLAVDSAALELEIPPDRVINEVIDAGWQSVKADWLRNRMGTGGTKSPPDATRHRTLEQDLTDTSWSH